MLVGVVGVASVGCSFELEQPEWVTQALCDHVFDEEEVLKEATCTEDGRVMKVCTECGKTKITTVKATGHDVVEDEAVDGTCATPGLTAGSHCTACGEVLVKQEEVVVEHTYGEWTVDVAATCTTEGSQKRVCTVCGDTETESIPAAHIDAANDGTCDVCEGSMFENASYAAVAEGDVAGGWYRANISSGCDYLLRFTEFKFKEDGLPLITNIENGRIESSSSMWTFAGKVGIGIESYGYILESGAYVTTYNKETFISVDVGEYRYFYIPEEINFTNLIINRNSQPIKENVSADVSGCTFEAPEGLEKVVF